MNVVLLHAFPLDPRMWEPQRDALREHTVHAPNLYAMAGSFEERARRVLDSLAGDFVAVGASMGGYCALALAAQAPERLRGIVLAGARVDADSPERLAGRADTIELIDREGPEALWREMRPKLFPAEANPEVVRQARAIALEQDPEGLTAAVEAIRDRPDSTGLVAGLNCPVLVIVGEHDPFFPPGEARELAAATPAVELAVLDGAGHLPNLEQPAVFNGLVRELLARAEP